MLVVIVIIFLIAVMIISVLWYFCPAIAYCGLTLQGTDVNKAITYKSRLSNTKGRVKHFGLKVMAGWLMSLLQGSERCGSDRQNDWRQFKEEEEEERSTSL